MARQYYNGQGYVDIAVATAGSPGKARWTGNVTSFKITPEESKYEHKESYSGLKSIDLTYRTELKLPIEITLEQVDLNNFYMFFNGEAVAQSGGSVTNETLEGSTTIAVGDVFYLDSVDVSSLVITDSTGTPKTLTSGTNYSANLKTGRVEILDITTGGAFTGPLKAAYTAAAETKVKLFTDTPDEYWIYFSGVNTAVTGSPACRGEFYRVKFSPAELSMITDGDAPQQFVLRGDCLADPTKTLAGTFGPYGSWWQDGV
jgi:hypothetical protein